MEEGGEGGTEVGGGQGTGGAGEGREGRMLEGLVAVEGGEGGQVKVEVAEELQGMI